jgi:hypothetical protein
MSNASFTICLRCSNWRSFGNVGKYIGSKVLLFFSFYFFAL